MSTDRRCHRPSLHSLPPTAAVSLPGRHGTRSQWGGSEACSGPQGKPRLSRQHPHPRIQRCLHRLNPQRTHAWRKGRPQSSGSASGRVDSVRRVSAERRSRPAFSASESPSVGSALGRPPSGEQDRPSQRRRRQPSAGFRLRGDVRPPPLQRVGLHAPTRHLGTDSHTPSPGLPPRPSGLVGAVRRTRVRHDPLFGEPAPAPANRPRIHPLGLQIPSRRRGGRTFTGLSLHLGRLEAQCAAGLEAPRVDGADGALLGPGNRQRLDSRLRKAPLPYVARVMVDAVDRSHPAIGREVSRLAGLPPFIPFPSALPALPRSFAHP